MQSLRFILTVFLLIKLVEGFGQGAGPQACLTLTPQHYGTNRQPTNAPFILQVNATSVKSRGIIRVTLSANADGATFKGFLVQARCTKCASADTSIVPGTFSKNIASDPTKAMDCAGGNKNSMTHADKTDKTSVSFIWTAPANVDVSQGIEFRAAVVQSFNTWWSYVRSQEISFVEGLTTTSQKPRVVTTTETDEFTGFPSSASYRPTLLSSFMLLIIIGNVLFFNSQ